ncbi:MAG: CsgG/HfaB family protein [Candidatus Fibromonas sp.]|jgi:hypothetical protein|nr:CsgG/HfaB family protein [Candidatus Fibromonas sp.]
MNKTIIILLSLFTLAVAQGKPKIAVYATGAEEQGTNKALETHMLTALVNSGQYQTVERSEEFLAQLAAERSKQHSGAIENEQIKKLGKQFGVDFICIADITPALSSNMVSVRIVNVETAEVAAMGYADSPLKVLPDLTDASQRVVTMMFGVTEQPVQEEIPEPEPEPAPEPVRLEPKYEPYVERREPVFSEPERPEPVKPEPKYEPQKSTKRFDPSSIYFSFYKPSVKSFYDYKGQKIRSNGLNTMIGFEVMGSSLFGGGLFIGGGKLGSNIGEFILGADVKKLLWFWEEVIAIPLSVDIAWRAQFMGIENRIVATFIDEPKFLKEPEDYLNKKRTMNKHNFDIMPSIDLQFFIGSNFSLYGGYMYRITYSSGWSFTYKTPGKNYGENKTGDNFDVPEEFNPLKNSKETVFILKKPGTLRFGAKFHFN